MYNCNLMKFKCINGQYGKLVPIEGNFDVPFQIKRVFYIYGVDSNVIRGHHALRKSHQILICLKGSVKIRLRTPIDEEIVELSNPEEGLYIGKLIWREMFDFSEDAVLFVLASEHFEEEDYIRNYDFYLNEAKDFFR
ncbi:sugar 3,4-ketoisomerase [Clostridium neuense]|uniref:Sugar 3,4-ketoisomerase n=1 Tax=Clostridium neuense TaxID=1728934 RepID=A0ABW8TGS5_9CLOT